MFSPYRPNGDYLLNMAVYEEKTVAKMLCELAKSEGWNLLTALKINGQAIEKPNNEVFQYVKFLKNQDNFSTWAQKDPNMKSKE